MEINNNCCCCLARPPDKHFMKPYIVFGKTEIFSDMLTECFEINLTIPPYDYECGICEECVGRLRDASDFKLQVQRSQRELRALVEACVKDEEPLIKLDMSDDVKEEVFEDILGNGEVEDAISEILEEPLPTLGTEDELCVELIEAKTEPESMSSVDEWFPCSVLEGLRDDSTKQALMSKSKPTFDSKETLTKRGKAMRKPLDTSGNTKKKTNSCNICGKQFALETYLKKHMKLHTELDVQIYQKELRNYIDTMKNLYYCDMCTYQSPSRTNLIRHLVNKHTEPKPCQICNKVIKGNPTLKVHMRRHERVLRCEICDVHFKSKTEVWAHKHITDKPYGCDVCDKKFKSISSMRIHKRLHIRYTCQICKEVVSTRAHANFHKETYECEYCDEKFDRLQNLNMHKQEHSTGLYCCEICGKQFALLDKLKAHLLSHSNEKPYVCDICLKRFSNKSSLGDHIKSHMERKEICKMCGKKFATKGSLTRHMLIHSSVKAFSCDKCDMRFRSKDKLQSHKKTHTRDRPFLCTICGKGFARKDYLRPHLKTHVEGRTFSCELCPKSYSTKEGLRQHKRVHNGKKVVAKSRKSKKKN